MATGPDVPNIEVGERIGGGAFGEVFRGHHRTLQVDVAVKVLNADAVTDVDRALNEARLMARLDHPNLLRIFDAGRTASGLYLVLELMDATCAEHRHLSPEAALDTILQLLGGLQALHDARVLHRDIKPANCLVRQRDGRVKLADLGIAVEQSTRTRQFDFAGTLPFMAPELFEQPPRFSPSSDLYALGITMQCLVLESDPYPRGPMSELMAWIHDGTRVNVAHRRPDLPVSLSTLIDRMCARASTERPAVAADALRALSSRTAPTVVRSGDEPTVTLIGSWVLGTEIAGDANFRQHAVTHVRTGAAGRLAVLKSLDALKYAPALIIASAERASRLSHPGIADVIDWGLHNDRAYIVTRAQGQSLKAIVESSGPIHELEAVELTRDLADALAYLHGVGLVYQVVNPMFATMAPDARSVQLAWPMFCVPVGSKALTKGAPALVAVPLFAPPESLFRPPKESEMDLRINEGADLYGLGEILFYLIAGQAAYAAAPEMPRLLLSKARAARHLRDVAPMVTATTAQLVADLTAPDPRDRPASAAVVRDRLDKIARGLGCAY